MISLILCTKRSIYSDNGNDDHDNNDNNWPLVILDVLDFLIDRVDLLIRFRFFDDLLLLFDGRLRRRERSKKRERRKRRRRRKQSGTKIMIYCSFDRRDRREYRS